MKYDESNIISRFEELSTSVISDALDSLGIVGCLENISPVSSTKTICGYAFTVDYEEVIDSSGTVGDFLDIVSDDNIVVINNDGRTNCTVWGDIMSTYASIKGIKGTVINGVCRDINNSRLLDYPIYSKGVYMRTGKDRVKLSKINEKIRISNIDIFANDIIVADSNGVLVIPNHMAMEVYMKAKEINDIELKIVESIKEGMSLIDARKINGYHNLQKK